MSFPYAVRYLSYYFFFTRILHTSCWMICITINPISFFFLYIIYIKISFLYVFFTDSLRHQKTRSWICAYLCVRCALFYSHKRPCCLLLLKTMIVFAKRQQVGRRPASFLPFKSSPIVYTHIVFFLFCFSDETSLPVILPASTQQRSNNNSAKKKNNSHIYTQVDICVHSRRTPLIHR